MSPRILRYGEVARLGKSPWCAGVSSLRAQVAEHVAANPDATLHSTAEALDRTPRAVSGAVNWLRGFVFVEYVNWRRAWQDHNRSAPEAVSKCTRFEDMIKHYATLHRWAEEDGVMDVASERNLDAACLFRWSPRTLKRIKRAAKESS